MWRILYIFGLLFLIVAIGEVEARVVISEVMWMGSDVSTADEWVELTPRTSDLGLRTSGSGFDIGGWRLTSRKSSGEEVTIVQFATGTLIGSGQYFLVSNYGESKSRLSIAPDVVTTAVMLPNTKLFLRLYDTEGNVVDEVDDGVGKPFAGENPSGGGTKASMERIDLSGSGALKENWRSTTGSINFDSGALIFGTPGAVNGSGSLSPEDPPEEPPTGSGSSTGEVIDPEATEPPSGTGSTTGTIILPPVVITEVLANPIGRDDEEWIEIGNLGSGSVSIAGWVLDEGNSSGDFTIPEHRTASGAFPPRAASGFVLAQGEHVSFRKSVTGLPLGNKGEMLTLMGSGGVIIDTWTYPETVEEVSYGRDPDDPSQLRAFCVPTEGRSNSDILLDPFIGIQSGQPTGTGKVTINLQATVATGSLASASCQWDFGSTSLTTGSDGFTSESCNPPSHTFSSSGTYTVMLSVETYCGNTITGALVVRVIPEPIDEVKEESSEQESGAQASCAPSVYTGISISEFLPNPFGEEKENEWIELRNTTDSAVHLCGWSIDDEEGGSKPYDLDDESIGPHGYLLLPRFQTKIALNNDGDVARLIAPDESMQEVPYGRASEGESFSLRSDGLFVWTPYPTPEKENRFRTAERRFPTDTVVVSAALPNPEGKDKEGEWVEITNVSEESISLDGWMLDNKDGGSSPFVLDSIRLEPRETRRLTIQETGINLVNTEDVARVLDPDGYVVSILSWSEAVSGRIYRPAVLLGERVRARVVRVVDGDTIDIELTDIEQFPRIPSSLKKRWFLATERGDATIRVRFIGIDTPETVHPSKAVERFGKEASDFTRVLLEGKNVELELEEELWDKYNRLLAYIFVDGKPVQPELLRHGLAYAYTRFPFVRQEEYLAYEAEARGAKLGIWSDEETVQVIEMEKEGVEQERIIEEIGLELTVDPPPGLVSSGTVVTFTPNVTSALYLSVNSGTYSVFSGSYIVTEDVALRVYAERRDGEDTFKSEIAEVAYVLERETYKAEVVISEVYPSPRKGEGEWIELFNPTNHDVSLAGWLLDDIRDGGSRPWTIPPEIVVPAGEYLVLTKEQTGLALNNDGDEVWLISPDGEVEVGMAYPKVKKGKAFAAPNHSLRHSGSGQGLGFGLGLGTNVDGCVTDVSTPGAQNICRTLAKKKVRKTSSQKPKKKCSRKKVTRTEKKSKREQESPLHRGPKRRYRNVLIGREPMEDPIPEIPERFRRLREQIVDLDQQKSGPIPVRNREVNDIVIAILLALPALRFLRF